MDNTGNSSLISNLGANNLYSYLVYLKDRVNNEILYYKRMKALQKIMKNNSMSTYFQPILKLNTGETIGFEALNRPAETNLFPSTEDFYEFVGQSNQIFLVECFCRNNALKRFVERLNGNFQQEATLIFINIHPCVLMDSNYHSGETLQLISSLEIDPRQVVFELTERSAVTDYSMFEKVLSHYRSQGFRIAIDDVGSGYNSLKTLICLKPEFIKLDRSLIENIDQNFEKQQLVKLIIEYAKQSKTEIIAEGIERAKELAFIRKHGVDYAQGFALGKPLEEVVPGSIPIYSKKYSNTY
jgi:EAL domain-containing protein (putative c-di-GMP-specific phosphodiesterase class I)